LLPNSIFNGVKSLTTRKICFKAFEHVMDLISSTTNAQRPREQHRTNTRASSPLLPNKELPLCSTKEKTRFLMPFNISNNHDRCLRRSLRCVYEECLAATRLNIISSVFLTVKKSAWGSSLCRETEKLLLNNNPRVLTCLQNYHEIEFHEKLMLAHQL